MSFSVTSNSSSSSSPFDFLLPLFLRSSSSPSSLLRLFGFLLFLGLGSAGLISFIKKQRILAKLNQAKRLKLSQYHSEVALMGDLSLQSNKQHLNHSTKDLIAKVQSNQLKCVDIIRSYIKECIHLNSEFNVLTETNFASALKQAESIDSMSIQQRKELNLAGIPISMKDSVNLKGLDTTLGLVCYSSLPSQDDALIVKILKASGAIIHTKTNIPQTLLSFECSNPLFGRTSNIYNKSFTCGGSSGGEAALIAGGGSKIGIGTDIGGSVRIPAHFSGIAAIKTTSRRISTVGFRPSVPGQEAVPGVAGVMGLNVNDLALVLTELLSEKAWDYDHEVVPLPFNKKEYENNGKLRVGYYINDDFMPPSPACARAVQEAVNALSAAGHEVILFKPPSVMECVLLYYKLLSSDNGNTVSRQLKEEIWEDYVKTIVSTAKMNKTVKKMLGFAIKFIAADKKAAALFEATGERTTEEYWKLQYERKKYRQLWIQTWQMEENQFDILITPAHILPAVKHSTYKNISFTCAPTMIFNVLDWPAGVVPITKVKSTDVYLNKHEGILEKKARDCYNPIESEGLPVGIQVVGLPFRDEVVLRGMRIIEQLIQYKRPNINN